jgi:hypothetical protein
MKRISLGSIVLLMAFGLAACGGSGGGGMVVDSQAPALDFAFKTPTAPLNFTVEFTSEAEVRGTSYISSVRYEWETADWQVEDEAWTCDLTFNKVKGAQRSGGGIRMEVIEGFNRLEGFSTRYRKDAEGFGPVIEPAKDKEFMGMFGQLQNGLAPLDFTRPSEPVRPGATWTEIMDEMDMLAGAMQDSVMTLRYEGDELYQGRDCARISFSAKIPLEGIIDVEEGPQAGTRVKIGGKIEISGQAWFDKELGFLIRDEGKSKSIIEQQEVDKRGKPQGGERSFVQNTTFKVSYLGE